MCTKLVQVLGYFLISINLFQVDNEHDRMFVRYFQQKPDKVRKHG